VASSGTVPLKDIWAMLDDCAPGYQAREREHNWLVIYAGKSFPRLPRGPHGKRQNPGIQVGHIKQMVRFFEIQDCAGRHLEALRT
jgi:hypothetical protein